MQFRAAWPVLVILTVCLAWLPGCAPERAPEFFSYESKRNHFRVDLPEWARNRVRFARKTLNTAVGPVLQDVYRARSRHAIFEVRITRIPAGMGSHQAEALAAQFEERRAGAVVKKRTLGGFNARSVRVALGKRRIVDSAMLVMGPVLFQVRVTATTKAYLDGPEAARFFTSFAFVQPTGEETPAPGSPPGTRAGADRPPPEQPAAYTLTRDDLGFTVDLPLKARNVSDQDLTLMGDNGSRLQGRAVTAGDSDLEFSVGVFKAAVAPGESPGDVLVRVRNHIAGQAVRVFSEGFSPHATDGALDMRYAFDNNGRREFAGLKAVVRGRTLYLLTALTPHEDVFAGRDMQQFFDTFILTDSRGAKP